jgi:hypothetical protein
MPFACQGGHSAPAKNGQRQSHFLAKGHHDALPEVARRVVAIPILNGYGHPGLVELTLRGGEDRRAWPDGTGRRDGPTPTHRVEVSDRHSVAGHAHSGEGGSQPAGWWGPVGSGDAVWWGLAVGCCEVEDLRQSAGRVFVYTGVGRRETRGLLDVAGSSGSVERSEAVNVGRLCFPGGEWGKARLEDCLSVLKPDRTGPLVQRQHQIEVPPSWCDSARTSA